MVSGDPLFRPHPAGGHSWLAAYTASPSAPGYTPYKVTYASDYFDQLYAWAVELIRR